MGLDTYIRTEKGEELAYFRKDWTLQQWWIDLARVKYLDLANKWDGEKPIEETDGIDKEYYKKIYEEGDFNCVAIPITKEDWIKFLDYINNNHGDEYFQSYKEATEKILGASTYGEKVFIYGWW
jgi:folate-dependent tRNA-U54 methylase TrmFO/GidA